LFDCGDFLAEFVETSRGAVAREGIQLFLS